MNAIALDTNLMVLLCLGQSSQRHIGTHQRIQGYTQSDFETLLLIVGESDLMISTPFSLAQVSDLLGISSKKSRRRSIFLSFQYLATQVDERFVPSSKLVVRDEFADFGLADTGWLALLDSGVTFYSADLALVNHANALGKRAEWLPPSNQ